jgi:hypothetical protein
MGAYFVFLEKIERLMILRDMKVPDLVMIVLPQACNRDVSQS